MAKYSGYGKLVFKILKETRPSVAVQIDKSEVGALIMQSVNAHFINRSLYHANVYQDNNPVPVQPELKLRYMLNREAYVGNEINREARIWVNNFVPNFSAYSGEAKKIAL